METIAIVLSVGTDQVETFEAGFRAKEVPVWDDLAGRGLLLSASLSKLEISSRPAPGAQQYLIVAVFATGEGHHEHDHHPGFEAWNREADAYQVADAMAFGGATIVTR
jgi:hypothetical protein